MTGLGQTRKSSVTLGMSVVEGEADEIRAKADIAPQPSFSHDALNPRYDHRYMRQMALAATRAAERGL